MVVEHFGLGIFTGLFEPIFTIGKAFVKMLSVIVKIFEMLYHVLEMIPVVFDPPRLVNDILFAITTSITTILDRAMNSVDVESAEDDEKDLYLNY